jgi:integrase/recombinase XerD
LISKAIEGFMSYKTAEGLTERTLESYQRIMNKWLAFEGDKNLYDLKTSDLTRYLSWLRTEYVPRRYNGKTHPLSSKTTRNVYVTFKSFYKWAKVELHAEDLMTDIKAPKFQHATVVPFKKEEIEKLIKACRYSREAETVMRKSFSMRRPTAKRDEAIILTLLDTGLRAKELCMLTIGNLDIKSGKIEVKHGIVGGAKGGKGRIVYLGKSARKSVWRYLADREDGDDMEAPLFLGIYDRPLTPNALRHLIVSIASRAGVKNAYPHKFRHTFAITYLRAGGDVFTLQALLGHSSLDMVQHYAAIAQIDVQNAHRKSSPVDSWRL